MSSAQSSSTQASKSPQPNPFGKFIAEMLIKQYKAQNPNVNVPDFPNMGYHELKKWINKNKPEQRHP